MHYTLEPLSRDEILSIGKRSFVKDNDSVIINTVSTTKIVLLIRSTGGFQTTNTIKKLEVAGTSVSSSSRM